MTEVTENDFVNGLLVDDSCGINATYNINDYTIRLEVKDEAEDVVNKIKDIYNAVLSYNEEHADKKATIMVDLKHCSVEKKAELIKFALQFDKLEDPLMLLNILNLIKVYNTLDESYFKSADVYVNSIEELLDLKLAINSELKEFSKRLVIYFLGVLKSYNKMAFTPADEHIELPIVFQNIFRVVDIATIASLFAKCGTFSTDEVMYIDHAYTYMTLILSKSANAISLIEEFYTEKEDDNRD